MSNRRTAETSDRYCDSIQISFGSGELRNNMIRRLDLIERLNWRAKNKTKEASDYESIWKSVG